MHFGKSVVPRVGRPSTGFAFLLITPTLPLLCQQDHHSGSNPLQSLQSADHALYKDLGVEAGGVILGRTLCWQAFQSGLAPPGSAAHGKHRPSHIHPLGWGLRPTGHNGYFRAPRTPPLRGRAGARLQTPWFWRPGSGLGLGRAAERTSSLWAAASAGAAACPPALSRCWLCPKGAGSPGWAAAAL